MAITALDDGQRPSIKSDRGFTTRTMPGWMPYSTNATTFKVAWIVRLESRATTNTYCSCQCYGKVAVGIRSGRGVRWNAEEFPSAWKTEPKCFPSKQKASYRGVTSPSAPASRLTESADTVLPTNTAPPTTMNSQAANHHESGKRSVPLDAPWGRQFCGLCSSCSPAITRLLNQELWLVAGNGHEPGKLSSPLDRRGH